MKTANSKDHSNHNKKDAGPLHLYAFAGLGILSGLFVGACICMVMQQVLYLQPAETTIALAAAGWGGVIFYLTRLLYLAVSRCRD